MTDYQIAFTINASILVIFTAFLAWRYKVTIARRAKRQEFQYRLFGLRDKVIRLVVDGQISEEDENWKELYEIVNNVAKAPEVERMSNGFRFVLDVLRNIEPPSSKTDNFLESLPPPIQELWGELGKTMLTICWEGSFLLRIYVQLAHKYGQIRSFTNHKWPTQSKNYAGWRDLVSKTTTPAHVH